MFMLIQVYIIYIYIFVDLRVFVYAFDYMYVQFVSAYWNNVYVHDAMRCYLMPTPRKGQQK